jgi:hypothetical protein
MSRLRVQSSCFIRLVTLYIEHHDFDQDNPFGETKLTLMLIVNRRGALAVGRYGWRDKPLVGRNLETTVVLKRPVLNTGRLIMPVSFVLMRGNYGTGFSWPGVSSAFQEAGSFCTQP